MQKATLLCIATAVALAGTSMTADAAQRALTKQQQASVARIRANHKNFAPPRTMKDAERTQVAVAAKGTAIEVPLELYNQLSVQVDAQGNKHVVESDGAGEAAPAAEGLANE
jgi:hypothetical protein